MSASDASTRARSCSTSVLTSDNVSIKQSVVRLGINYKFDGPLLPRSTADPQALRQSIAASGRSGNGPNVLIILSA